MRRGSWTEVLALGEFLDRTIDNLLFIDDSEQTTQT